MILTQKFWSVATQRTLAVLCCKAASRLLMCALFGEPKMKQHYTPDTWAECLHSDAVLSKTDSPKDIAVLQFKATEIVKPSASQARVRAVLTYRKKADVIHDQSVWFVASLELVSVNA
jgi:hypothetical protein